MAFVTDISPEQKMLVLDAFIDRHMVPGNGIVAAEFDGPVLAVTVEQDADVSVPDEFHGCHVRVESDARGARTLPRRVRD